MSLAQSSAWLLIVARTRLGWLGLYMPDQTIFLLCSWSSNPELEVFEVDIDKVQLKEEIGRGSYGVVYKAAVENVK